MAAPVILAEASPRRAADGSVQTVRLAGSGAAMPYYYGGNHWMAGINVLPTVITSLTYDGTDIGTGGVPQAAELQWRGASEADVADLAGLVWSDADVSVHLGPENAQGVPPPLLLKGKVLTCLVDTAVLKVSLSDPAAALKVPLVTATFGGTGGLDGPADWAGTVKRRIWGRVWNIQGEPIDPVYHIYNFADPLHHLDGITSVRDKGAAASELAVLDWQGSAEATFAALQAAAVPAGGGIACPSIACVRWWTQPSGDLTADVRGELDSDGQYVETTAEIAARLVAEVDGPDFADGALAGAVADRPGPVGWVATESSTTVAAMLDTLFGSASLLWVLNSAGEIEIRRWEWNAPVASFISHSVNRTAAYRPVGTRKLVYRRNEHKMDRSALAAVVLVSDVAFEDGSGLAETLDNLGEASAAANSTASAAQAAANLANAGLADIASDNLLSPGEKSTVMLDYNVLVTEHGGIDGQAIAYGITIERDAYDAALTALLDYLATLTVPYSWSDITGATVIVGPTFRGKFADVYAARQTLLNAISAKAKLLADNATADAAAAADTATWAGIGGSTSGTDVASTVKPGGGVAAGNVSTAALQDDSVTGTLQGYNGSASSGAGRDNWITLVSWTENLEAAGDIIAIATIKQSWSSTNKPWGFRIVIDGMEAFGTGGIMVTDSVALSGHMRLESEGDYVVSLDFAAEDSTVSVVAGAASMITFKRYK